MTGQKHNHDHHDHVDGSGTPHAHSLYVVFDAEQQARTAERALKEGDSKIHTHLLRGEEDARSLRRTEDDSVAGLPGKLSRLIKRLGGETGTAERYAVHLDLGRAVLVVDLDHERADRLVDTLTRHDGYDVIYFGGGSLEHLSPAANAARGIPTEEMVSPEELKGEEARDF